MQNREVQFNLSHTLDLAVLSVTSRCAIGVDIETTRQIAPELARRFFSQAENKTLDNLCTSRWTETFLRIWTAKEAVAKAVGLGLALDFRGFDIDCSVEQQAVCVNTSIDSRTRLNCRFFSIQPEVCGCVAVITDLPIKLHHRTYDGATWRQEDVVW